MARIAHPKVTIIVLTWNQRDITLDCLQSLKALNYPVSQLRIIVVDNGSVDGTAQAVSDRFPSVLVLENPQNLGFAEGNNVGLQRALEDSADHIMLLNNDTVVAPEMLNELLAVLKSDPAVGIVGPKMLYYDQPDVIWSAGNRIDWRCGDTIRLQAEQPDSGLTESPSEVDFITACGILLRRQVIDQIGLLDRRYFIYYEETDWCMRARGAGWRIMYAPRARMWHKVSSAMGTTSPATEYYMNRNVLLFLAKHQRGFARLASLTLTAGQSLRMILAYTFKSHNGQRLPRRNARLLALRDAIVGRWGQMGPDVEMICYPK